MDISYAQLTQAPQTYSCHVRERLPWRQGPYSCHRGSEAIQGMGSLSELGGGQCKERQRGVVKMKPQKPAQPAPPPPDSSLQSLQSFCLPVACGEAGLVIDTHPLVKSLKMCPFPNRASEMQGSGSRAAQAAHSEPARHPDRLCVASLGARGILGPESLCKRSVSQDW